MTAGTVNVYIPLNSATGDRLTGVVAKGARAVARRTPRTDVRSFFDPDATRNLAGAIPVQDARHPLHPRNVAKRGPLPRIAPAGWSLRPVVLTVPENVVRDDQEVPEVEVPAEHCGKTFRTPSGYAWHLANVHPAADMMSTAVPA